MARSFNKRPDKVQKAFNRLANNRRNRIANRFEEMTDEDEQSYSRSDRTNEPSDREEKRPHDRGYEL